MTWKTNAACAGTPPDVFFPRTRHETQTDPNLWSSARTICGDCPVVAECLQYALTEDINQGMFGGLTPLERRRISRGPKTAPELRLSCGTQSGYAAHIHRNEHACGPCRTAHRADRRRRRVSHG